MSVGGYSERDNKIVLVTLSEGTMEKGKKILENKKYEYNIMYCTISCWILGKHNDRERVSNGGDNLIKALYIQA
jgi:hypothetical protein